MFLLPQLKINVCQVQKCAFLRSRTHTLSLSLTVTQTHTHTRTHTRTHRDTHTHTHTHTWPTSVRTSIHCIHHCSGAGVLGGLGPAKSHHPIFESNRLLLRDCIAQNVYPSDLIFYLLFRLRSQVCDKRDLTWLEGGKLGKVSGVVSATVREKLVCVCVRVCVSPCLIPFKMI
jgi:hypothetical protein